MGLIDNLRNKMNKNNTQNEKKSNTYDFTSILRNDGTEVNIFYTDIKFNVTHRDGGRTSVVTAKVVISKPGDTIIPDSGAPICFEIPASMDPEQTLRNGLLQIIDNQGMFNNLSYNNYNILGRFIFQDNQIYQQPFSNAVLQSVEKLDLELAKEREQRSMNIEQEERKRQNRERMKIEERIEQMNEDRKQNITFRYMETKIANGEKLESYNTVNMHTGREILLTDVRKIGKDEQSNYLYTANMQILENLAYRLRDDQGYQVVFSTAYKLDQIAQIQNPLLTKKISELLSVNHLTGEERTYLGQLDIKGNITRGLEEVSPAIQNNVKKLQEQFKNEHTRNDWNR